MNNTKPHCPVLFAALKFTYKSQLFRALSMKRHKFSGMIAWKLDKYFMHKEKSNFKNINMSELGAASPLGINFIKSKGYSPDGKHFNMQSFFVPQVDNSDIMDLGQRAYIFPACGHMFGYHHSLEKKPCPLCRKQGPFVPLAFVYEDGSGMGKKKPGVCEKSNSITSFSNLTSTTTPTHVFNPCGHVADLEVGITSLNVHLHWLSEPYFCVM